MFAIEAIRSIFSLLSKEDKKGTRAEKPIIIIGIVVIELNTSEFVHFAD